jgi:hypothetical protein
MLPIHAILLLLIPQIGLYIVLDKLNLKDWKFLVLGILIILNIWLLPSYFISKLPLLSGQVRCGLPASAIVIGFWFFGNGISILGHCLYMIWRKNKGTV